MQRTNGKHTSRFRNGGIEAEKDNVVLYENRKPIYLFILDYLAMTPFYDEPHSGIHAEGCEIPAEGTLTTLGGTVFSVCDRYALCGEGFSVRRSVRVEKEGANERGFASKFTLLPTKSGEIRDYNCFAPGVWYKQNDRVPPHFIGYKLDLEYFHWTETLCALPIFSMQHISSSEAVSLSRLAPDVTLRSMVRPLYTNYVDPTYTIGAVGMSRPKNITLIYDEMNATITRLPLDREDDPLGIDYVYPDDNGEIKGRPMTGVGMNPHRRQIPALNRMFHPIRAGFSDSYGVAVNFSCYNNFRDTMRDFWRRADNRLGAPLADTDCEPLYKNNMKPPKARYCKFNQAGDFHFCPS